MNNENADDNQEIRFWINHLSDFFIDTVYQDIVPAGTMTVLYMLVGTVGIRLGMEPETLQSTMQKLVDTALPALEAIKERNTNARH